MKINNFQKLYQFKGYTINGANFEEGIVQINFKFDKRCKARCPRCQSVIPKNKTATIMISDLPLSGCSTVYLKFPTAQGHCSVCTHHVTTRPKEVHPSNKATWRLMRSISSWARRCPATHVARMYGISDNTVRAYDKAVLKTDLPLVCFDDIRALLIDEKAVRRGHNYVTVVLNADSGELLYMAEGKKKEVIDAFFEKLTQKQRENIQAVGIDRAGAYQASVLQYLPNADIVYDRFHLMMNLNSALDEVRRQEWREASKEDKSVIKGSRFLTIANPQNLNQKGVDKLATLLKVNENLCVAYQLKEQFKAIFDLPDKIEAITSLEAWAEMAKASGLSSFKRLGKSLLRHKERVVGFITHRLTSGKIEGFNNQIARAVHMACGIRDLDYLELKLRQQSIM